MKLVFFKEYDQNRNYVDHLLRHGHMDETFEENPLIWHATAIDRFQIYRPCSGWIISDFLRQRLAGLCPPDWFRRIDESWDYDYDRVVRFPEAQVDKIVTRDDFGEVFWKKTRARRSAPTRPFYRFDAPRLSSMDNVLEVTVGIATTYEGVKSVSQEEVDVCLDWTGKHTASVIRGKYFLHEEVFDVLAPYLDPMFWRVFDLDEVLRKSR